MAPTRRRATNGYTYERQEDGSWKQVESAPGYSPSDQYDAANKGAFRDGGINDYLDEVMNASGMGSNVQGSTGGNAGKGSGSSGKSAEAGDGGKGEQAVQDALDNGIGLEEIAAGAAGAAAAAIAIKLLQSRKGKKGAADPAADTAGEADRGGKGSPDADIKAGTDIVASNKLPAESIDDPNGIVDAVFDEKTGQYALPPAMKQLPAPEAEELPAFNDVINAYKMGKGTQPATDLRNPDIPAEAMDPEAAQWVEKIKQLSSGSPVDASIQAVEGPDAPMLDPDLEAALQAYAQQMREQGNFDPSLDPSKNPGLPMMDEAVMRRLRSIIAGM